MGVGVYSWCVKQSHVIIVHFVAPNFELIFIMQSNIVSLHVSVPQVSISYVLVCTQLCHSVQRRKTGDESSDLAPQPGG